MLVKIEKRQHYKYVGVAIYPASESEEIDPRSIQESFSEKGISDKDMMLDVRIRM